MTIRSYETLPNFPCFILYLAACMHAFCMFYLYVSLGCLLKLVKVNKQVFAITLLNRNLNHTAQLSISATGGNNNFVSRAGGGGEETEKTQKFKVFFRKKTHLFFHKNPNFERSANSYYSSRILWQICYNLVKKNWRSETWTNIVLVWTQSANIGLKKRQK